MSRIGQRPITVPNNVEIVIDANNNVSVKGPKGQMNASFDQALTLKREENVITVERPNDQRRNRSLHGLTRTLLSNMVVGVTDGFRKSLDVQGVGYRAAMDGKTLVLNVGYSHQVFPGAAHRLIQFFQRKAVVGRHASAPVHHQRGFLQLGQMGRDARLCQARGRRQLSHGQFLADQQGQQTQAGRISQQAQQRRTAGQVDGYIPSS